MRIAWSIGLLFAFHLLLGQGESLVSKEKDFLHLSDSLQGQVRNHPSQSLEFATELLALGKKEDWFLGDVFLNRGMANWYLGNYEDGLRDYRQALDAFQKEDKPLGMAKAWQGMGMVEWRLGNFAGANKYIYESFKIRESKKDSSGLMNAYYWLGIIQASLGSFPEARDYYEKALMLARLQKDKQQEADILNVIGRAWRKEEVYDKALAAHAQSIRLYRQSKDSLGLSDYHNNVGSIYRRQGDFDKALGHFYNALVIQQKLQDKEGLADGYTDIGKTYMQKGEFGKAISYLKEGLRTAREIQLLDDVRYAYETLSSVYDSLGDYKMAYDYHLLFTQVKDSIYDLTSRDIINQQRFDYEWQKAAEERKLREKDIRQRVRVVLIVLLALLLIAGGIVAFFYWQSRIRARNNRKLAAKNTLIDLQRDRAEKLLLNILPESIADELKYSASGKIKARSYSSVSVMFVDFKRFTYISEVLTPKELVAELHYCFMHFDDIMERNEVEKIKTIGDAYMCAGGVPEEDAQHARKTLRAAMEIQEFMEEYQKDRKARGVPFFEARIGIHSGPVVAGVVGTRKFSYDIWGDTVNTAARMEASGEVGRVNISQSTYDLVKDVCYCKARGKVYAKNKGEVNMYFVEWAL